MDKSVLTREDNFFLYHDNYTRKDEHSSWKFIGKSMKSKDTLWFASEPKKILENIGISIDKTRAIEVENLFDGWLDGFYYLSAANDIANNGPETVKWLMGGIAQYLNETNQSIKDIRKILPANHLGYFLKYLLEGKFPKSFAKDVFAVLLTKEKHLSGEDIMNEIIANPKFKAVDDSVIDTLIDQVIAANPDNASKVASQPKLVQWFVGQVMKQSTTKLPAPEVLNKLKQKFNVE